MDVTTTPRSTPALARALAARGAAVVAASALLVAEASACPTCRESLAGADGRWARGFSLSIVFLLGALVAIVGTFSFAVWRAVRTRD